MPFVILDIETTGLDVRQAQLLEVAAIYVDNFQKESHEYETFHAVVKQDILTYVESGAVPMIAKWREKEKLALYGPSLTVQNFSEFLVNRLPKQKITFAGKNVATFDIPILNNYGLAVKPHHRVIDVGSMYFADFGYVPSLNEINKMIGRNEVAHTALEDCYDVLAAIRNKVWTALYYVVIWKLEFFNYCLLEEKAHRVSS